MVLTSFGVIDTVEAISIEPNNKGVVQEIVDNDNSITLTFDRDMVMNAGGYTTSAEFDPKVVKVHENKRRVTFKFNEELKGIKYIRINGYLVATDGKRYPIKLSYKEE